MTQAEAISSQKRMYDRVYLSPHLDDVALSCGGQIYQATQAGESVLVVSVMAGSPADVGVSAYAQSLHERWQLAETAVEARRKEDLRACEILGAQALHWDIPDCIYRVHPEHGEPFYQSDEDIFGEVDPADAPLIQQVSGLLETLPPYRQLVAPLTVGHHVDHQIVRAAAEVYQEVYQYGQRRGEPASSPLVYYEDYPYAQEAGALARVIGEPPVGWQVMVTELTADAVEVKARAIAAFVSQVSTFFTDLQDLSEQIAAYIRAAGGERTWRRIDVDQGPHAPEDNAQGPHAPEDNAQGPHAPEDNVGSG